MNLALHTQENSIASLYPLPEDEKGYSESSQMVKGYLKEIREHYMAPATRKRVMLAWDDAFRDIVENYLEEGWDGYDASPVTEQTIKEAYKFICLLPLSLPTPDEISADPDGDISFEWYKATNYIFTVSVSEKKTIAYAGIFGTYTKVHGSEYFDFKIPSSILDNIKKFK